MVKRINQSYAVSDTPIYVDKDCLNVVKKGSEEAYRLLAWTGQPFPIASAIRLGLLTEDEPIALVPLEKTDETKAVKEAPENKAVLIGSTKKHKEE